MIHGIQHFFSLWKKGGVLGMLLVSPIAYGYDEGDGELHSRVEAVLDEAVDNIIADVGAMVESERTTAANKLSDLKAGADRLAAQAEAVTQANLDQQKVVAQLQAQLDHYQSPYTFSSIANASTTASTTTSPKS